MSLRHARTYTNLGVLCGHGVLCGYKPYKSFYMDFQHVVACRHADIQRCRHADMQRCRQADMWTCRHTDMQRCRHAAIDRADHAVHADHADMQTYTYTYVLRYTLSAIASSIITQILLLGTVRMDTSIWLFPEHTNRWLHTNTIKYDHLL